MCAMTRGEGPSGPVREGTVPVVTVGPFHVMDATRAGFVKRVVWLTRSVSGPVLVYALHVGGLNARADQQFVAAMEKAAVVYADGGSVVWLARLAGARGIERAPTTDDGWDVGRVVGSEFDRSPRLALIGGPTGLAERAASVLEANAPVQVVFTEHGYHEDWSGPLGSLRETAPDLILVGLGAPAEMIWCERHRDALPAALVMTVGGWFGHLAGDEQRAPRLLRRSGVEWVARLAQSPRRLGPRYARGLWSAAAMSVPAWRQRPKPERG